MIDIHSHILPGVDDGASSEEESLAMARQAVDQGLHTMSATPHNLTNRYHNEGHSILMYTEILNELSESNNIPLTLLPGQEARINGEFIEKLRDEEILPLSQTDFVFVELPYDHLPLYTDSLIYDIQMDGA